MSIHGRFAGTRRAQWATKLGLTALSVVLLVQPAPAIAVPLAIVVLGITAYGWFRTRKSGRRATESSSPAPPTHLPG